MKNVKCKNCARYLYEWCDYIVDSPYPDMERDCPFFVQKTNHSNIKAMKIEELASYLVEIGWDCNYCSEDERLSDNPLLRWEKCDNNCELHCKEWLEKEVNE